MQLRQIGHAWALVMGVLCGAAPVGAETWPTRPVTLVVGAPAGSGSDAYARVIAEQMGKTLGQRVVVDNKPGATGSIAAEQVLRTGAAGYSLWVANQGVTEISPSVYSALRWRVDDFVPVIRGVQAPLVLVAYAGLGVTSLAELVAWLKANPRRAAYASYSPGTLSHLLGHRFGQAIGVELAHVGYKGSPAQLTDIASGEVPFGFAQIQTAAALIKAGKLVPLATTGPQRFRLLADVPTAAELGHPDLTATIWFGLFASAATPPDTLRRIVEAAASAHADPDVRTRLEAQGQEVSGETGASFAQSVRVNARRWGQQARSAGLTPSE